MHTKTYFLIGGGGHGKVVYNAMQLMGVRDIQVWDDCASLLGQNFLDTSIVAPVQFDKLGMYGHVAIGSCEARRKVSMQLDRLNIKKVTVIHPAASLTKYVSIGDGSFIAAQSVVGPECKLGESVIINHGAVVDHDCSVGDFSHIAPNATLGGEVHIGENCLIGTGAIILPRIKVAKGVTVGAGAVVTRDIIEEGIVVWGVPAK